MESRLKGAERTSETGVAKMGTEDLGRVELSWVEDEVLTHSSATKPR